MRALAASSAASLPADAVLQVGERLRALQLDRSAPSCALVFATTHLARDPVALSAAVRDLLGDDVPFVGFVGRTAVHDARLRERKPALSMLVLEGARGDARTAALAGAAADVAGGLLADAPRGASRFLSVAADAGTPGALLDFLPALDDQHVPVAGCLSVPPAGQRPSILAAELPRSGDGPEPAAALLDVDGVSAVLGVAQAARPLGPARSVTAATGNVIQELDGRPAVEALLRDLPASLRSRIPQLGGALCAGIGTAGGEALLMRHVVGLDPTTGAVAVAGVARVGAEIVFTMRDRTAARHDLLDVIDGLEDVLGGTRPLAFVLFDCAARDGGLFGVQNHDAQQLLARFGTDVPVVGVAGGGELCTYGAATYLFGMSCVVAALIPAA